MPKRKSTQLTNKNTINIVINENPKRRRRRRRRPKALMNSVNNLRFSNNLKPILSYYPLSAQMFHQDKLTTEGLKESHIKTTEYLKKLTDFMTSNMGQRREEEDFYQGDIEGK